MPNFQPEQSKPWAQLLKGGHTPPSVAENSDAPATVQRPAGIDPTSDLVIYPTKKWTPVIRPCNKRRQWMDETNDHANRCLPLLVANGYGWAICAARGITIIWNGGDKPGDLSVVEDSIPGEDNTPGEYFDAHVGHGIMTMHLPFVIRTPENVDTLITGPFNFAVPGLAPCSGIVETDWFISNPSMNFRVLDPNRRIRIEAGTELCLLVPLQRGLLQRMRPRIANMKGNPQLDFDYREFERLKKAQHEYLAQRNTRAKELSGLYVRGLNEDANGNAILRAPSALAEVDRSALRDAGYSETPARVSSRASAEAFDAVKHEVKQVEPTYKLPGVGKSIGVGLWFKRNEFALGETIVAEVTVLNAGEEPVTLPRPRLCLSSVSFKLTREAGANVPVSFIVRDNVTAETVTLNAGERVNGTIELLAIEPGTYSLTAVYGHVGCWLGDFGISGAFESAPKRITVKPTGGGKKLKARLTTDAGAIVLSFRPELAHNHVLSWLQLAKTGYFNGCKFHRVVPNFVIQSGDPTGTGRGPGYTLPLESNEAQHLPGALAMARLERHDAGSQFYICTARSPHLDGQYTVFGQVETGMDAVLKIGASEGNVGKFGIEAVEIFVE